MQTGLEGTRRRHDTAVFDRHVLSNGIVAWLQNPPILTSERGSLIVCLPGIGSQADPLDAHGTAHFVEHALFNSARDTSFPLSLQETVDKLGGSLDGQTSAGSTAYVVHLPKSEFNCAAEILSRMIVEPRFEQACVETERGTISQEHKRVRSDGKHMMREILVREFFDDHPLGHMPIGDLSVIAGMTAERLRAFHDTHYHSGNFTLVCGGAFSERGDILEILERTLGCLPRRVTTRVPNDFSSLMHRVRHVTVKEPRCGRDWFTMLYPIFPQNKAREYALCFLGNILSRDLNSPLVRELRTKRGLVYESGLCGTDTASWAWFFVTRVPVDSRHFSLTQTIFRDALTNLTKGFVVEEQRMQQLRRALEFRDPCKACEGAVNEITDYGGPISFEESDGLKDAVTLDDVFYWRDYLLEHEPFVCEIMAIK